MINRAIPFKGIFIVDFDVQFYDLIETKMMKYKSRYFPFRVIGKSRLSRPIKQLFIAYISRGEDFLYTRSLPFYSH